LDERGCRRKSTYTYDRNFFFKYGIWFSVHLPFQYNILYVVYKMYDLINRLSSTRGTSLKRLFWNCISSIGGYVINQKDNNEGCWYVNKMKKKYHTFGTFLKSNRKIVNRGKMDIPNTYIWLFTFLVGAGTWQSNIKIVQRGKNPYPSNKLHSFSWFGTDSSIKVAGLS